MDLSTSALAQLPEELLQETLDYLDKPDLLQLSQTCHWAYEKAIPWLWKDLELVDCRTQHDETQEVDEHDDTPIIKKLVTLAG